MIYPTKHLYNFLANMFLYLFLSFTVLVKNILCFILMKNQWFLTLYGFFLRFLGFIVEHNFFATAYYALTYFSNLLMFYFPGNKLILRKQLLMSVLQNSSSERFCTIPTGNHLQWGPSFSAWNFTKKKSPSLVF